MLISAHYFSIDQIKKSGQCFRIEKTSEFSWIVKSFGKILEIEKFGNNEYVFDCSDKEFYNLWENYFDLKRNYAEIRNKILLYGDKYLIRASDFGSGIRILKQDLFETIITFMISQQNNIPRIQKIIDNLCSPYSDQFPGIEILSQYTLDEFDKLKLGYRSKYIYNFCQCIKNGDFNFDYLKSLDYLQSVEYLKKFSGIGNKVANCIALYGLRHIRAFPRDVWINRIIDKHYNGNFDISPLQDYAGIIQQYMFFYERFH